MDHHYVPQFYTRRWTNAAGRVLCHRRVPNGRIAGRGVAPRGTGYEPDLYAAPSGVPWESYDEHIIEREFFSPIDNRAAVILDRLAAGVAGLTVDERRDWALFLNSMRHRHRDGICERDSRSAEVAAATTQRFLDAATDPADRMRIEAALAEIDVEQLTRTMHRTQMVLSIRDPETIAAITNLAWDTVTVNEDLPLITTDRPVLENLGRSMSELQFITMPLSPTRLFVAYPAVWRGADGSMAEGFHDLLRDIVFGHDLLLMHEQRCRFVYASRPLKDYVSDGRVIRMSLAVEEALRRG